MSAAGAAGGGGGAIPPWKDLILLGFITRTQGHRGAVRMRPEFEPLDLFEGLKSDELILKLKSHASPAAATGAAPSPAGRAAIPRVVHVSEYFFHQQSVILSFEEIPDMTAAEHLRGSEVYVRPEDLWDLPEGEFFTYEVVGFTVADAESGRVIGTVRTVQSGAAHDFLMVRREEPKSEFPVPLVKEFVKTVDKEGKRILVTLPEGLEEL